MKYWEITAANLGKAGFSWGCVATVDWEEWSIWVVSADRGEPDASLCTLMKS